MLDPQMRLRADTIQDELLELTRQRPLYDRPDEQEHGRLRRLLRSLAQRPAHPAHTAGGDVPNVTVRPALATDRSELARLAAVSERRIPPGLVLLAEVDEVVVAALPMSGGPLLSDLWTPSENVAQLLELRSEQVRAAEARRAA
jgi:hypothetical protein